MRPVPLVSFQGYNVIRPDFQWRWYNGVVVILFSAVKVSTNLSQPIKHPLRIVRDFRAVHYGLDHHAGDKKN